MAGGKEAPLSIYTKVNLMVTKIERCFETLILPRTAITEVEHVGYERKLFLDEEHHPSLQVMDK